MLVEPAFSKGLSACLVGNETKPQMNIGVKPLQITGHSLATMITFYGQPIADRFPIHAEQFNQNINSQSMNSVNLTMTSLHYFQQYLAIAALIAVQAVDLRCKQAFASYYADNYLSTASVKFYTRIKEVQICSKVILYFKDIYSIY